MSKIGRYDVERAKHASERAAAVLLLKMGRGRASLRSIASSAPYIGFLATLMGIKALLTSPEGPFICGECGGGVSEEFLPPLIGLIAAILASCVNGYLCSQVEALDVEMRAATLELANALSLLSQRIRE
jgi:biopolymer transport protein ExbB/TolQ